MAEKIPVDESFHKVECLVHGVVDRVRRYIKILEEREEEKKRFTVTTLLDLFIKEFIHAHLHT